MNLFLDTSSLFKLYHKETGTEIVDQIFIDNSIATIFLSEVASIEFSSTVWKKVRTLEISETQALAMIKLFEADFAIYTFVQVDKEIIRLARELLAKYGKHGLRTLDSIQLSTSVSVKDRCDLFLTTDKLLLGLFRQESLPV